MKVEGKEQIVGRRTLGLRSDAMNKKVDKVLIKSSK